MDAPHSCDDPSPFGFNYKVPRNRVNLKFRFWPTSEARRKVQSSSKNLLNNETSGKNFHDNLLVTEPQSRGDLKKRFSAALRLRGKNSGFAHALASSAWANP